VSRLGLAIVKRFASHDARIVIADISDEAGEEATALKERAIYVHKDVMEAASIAAAVKAAVEHFVRFDIMCNNAGPAGGPSATTELGERGFEKTFEFHARSALFGHKHAAGQFRHQGLEYWTRSRI
jgi:NAD(P)-dependent dehydrogenase (short-subunit alcohol dehydrogenase family)